MNPSIRSISRALLSPSPTRNLILAGSVTFSFRRNSYLAHSRSSLRWAGGALYAVRTINRQSCRDFALSVNCKVSNAHVFNHGYLNGAGYLRIGSS